MFLGVLYKSNTDFYGPIIELIPNFLKSVADMYYT